MTLAEDGNSVSFTTRDLLDLHLAKGNDQLWIRLVGAAIFVLGHAWRVWVSQLAAATATPRVKTTLVGQGNSVCVSTGDLNDFDRLKKIY